MNSALNHFVAIFMFTALGVSSKADDGYLPLFNGRDLTGWTNVNCAPETWTVQDGVIHCTGHPIGALRTPRQYENFILDLEWRHLSSGGNSGVFIWASSLAAPGVPFLRGIEVQVLDHGFNVPGKNEWYTTHGDVFPIHGATMKPFGRHNGMRSFPSEERSKGTPEWNQYQIVCSNGVIRLHVNGKEVSGGEDCNYRKGYIGLESEGAPVEFRNIRIKELPTNHPAPDVIAPVDMGWRSIFTGLDLRGWRTNSATPSRWDVRDGQIRLRTTGGAAPSVLWTEAKFGNAEIIVDCKPAKASAERQIVAPGIEFPGTDGKSTTVKLSRATPGKYQRFVITLVDRKVTITSENETESVTLPAETPASKAFGLSDTGGAVDFMNIYVRNLGPQ